MRKRVSRQSSKLEEKTSAKEIAEEEITEEKVDKKQFNSTTKTTSTATTTMKTPAKESAKEPVKMTLSELKNLKNLRKKQETILMNIENNNIQKHVSNLLAKFDPPVCTNCPNRRADRVCINKECGINQYMQLICGKCHLKQHQSSIIKPEIDLEEFFIKLSTFLNETKYDDKKTKQQRIDIDNLDTIFDDLDVFRQKLASLKSKIENEIDTYTSPMEMQGLLQNSITKALSLCEYDNIQEQLLNVKKSVLFEKNKFFWNDAGEKYKSFAKIFRSLEDTAGLTNKKISKSFIGGMDICLDELVVKARSNNLSFGFGGFGGFGGNNAKTEFKGKDGEIRMYETYTTQQYYLDYKLDLNKKYKLRFRFENQPSQYFMIGVMQKNQLDTQWVYNITNQYFCKRFLSNAPSQECSRLLKGADLSNSPTKGQQIEMRIDFENNYVDFYDFPDIKNVNASLTSNQFMKDEYVIAFVLNASETVVLESFCEISSIDELH